MWLPQLDDNNQPRYLALADAIAQAIGSGVLKPGDRLPPQRRLAWALGLNPSTAMLAYREAARRHLVSGEVGRGTYVLAGSREASLFLLRQPEEDPARLDLSTNLPVIDPNDHDLENTLAGLAEAGDLPALQTYPSARDLDRGRLAIGDWLQRRRGIEVPAGQIQLCAGAQQGLFATLLALCEPGEPILVEALTSPGIKAAARQLRLPLHPVPMDGEGILPDELDRLARASLARVVLLTPCLQNPTGVSMGAQRRAEIAEVARRRGLWLIEDDVYGALDDRPPLAQAVPERCVLVSSLSKTVAPGLRLGFIAGPAELLASIDREGQATHWAVASLSLRIASQWLEEGIALRRLDWQREQMRLRWRLASRLLGEPPAHARPAPHRWLIANAQGPNLADICRGAGVEVAPAEVFAVGHGAPNAVRLSLTAAAGSAQLKAALERIAARRR
ncbi:PLP-dependent aminotransferase family protein [Stutzerimonas nosocomialis]|uniref:aminotransferase-like domain-containing protein n=1 Tax=Stutzerimonas nosocomialis TaxID=1056496 RepID=UPI001108FE27|nr:PLP-dependent aminotransferase family protein [Stutzerimonas nosocomialis]TLX60716.1 PLP-dependent aminotransferase family protein [Stutzerimonas nosocomialis]